MAKAVDVTHLEKKNQSQVLEILKLFDGSVNGYRSITNVLLEYEKVKRDLDSGKYDLQVNNYVSINGTLMRASKSIVNKSLCPVCRRFPQSKDAFGLITGGPQSDSVYETYKNNEEKRQNAKICSYCFTSGWVDLPTALITKSGNSVSKQREYLFITTPLSQDDVKKLLDLITYRETKEVEVSDTTSDLISVGPTETEVDDDDNEDDEEKLTISSLSKFIEEKFGESLNTMPVLGLSQKRLKELQGFVLPSANPLQRIVAMRVPVDQLIKRGETGKVSGAVRRELIKATMYDFWKVTSSFSMHYNRIMNVPFSVDGQSIDLEDMRRANVAYEIANKYGRTEIREGKLRIRRYRLNSGVFMLLLSRPHQAANQMLRMKRREQKGRFAPNSNQIKEMIQMVEELTIQEDWKFG